MLHQYESGTAKKKCRAAKKKQDEEVRRKMSRILTSGLRQNCCQMLNVKSRHSIKITMKPTKSKEGQNLLGVS